MGAHAGEKYQQPGVWDGRDFVPEVVLRVREFVLGLRELSLACKHGAERGRRVRAEPAAAGADPADDRLRLLGVASCGVEPSALDRDQRQCRSGKRMTGHAALDARMLDHAESGRPRIVEVTREVERARIPGEGAREDLVRGRTCELDGATAVLHRLCDASVDRDRAYQQGERLDVGRNPLGPLCLRPIDDPEIPPLLDRAVTRHDRRGRRGDGELRMLEDVLVWAACEPTAGSSG